jgi:glycosyltransferase involved in cell wall biosynthesis
MTGYCVITACLNAGATIARTIDSVLAQDPPPSEYVFVDGGSIDGTLARVEETIAAYDTAGGAGTRFVVLHQTTRGGIYEAWNMALEAISAPVVFILNADDWYEPGAAAAVLDSFGTRPAAGIVLAGARLHVAGRPAAHATRHPRSLRLLPVLMPVVHPACFVKRSVYQRLGNFDASYRVSGDYEFLYRCHQAGVEMIDCGQLLVNVSLGGFAYQNRKLARVETREIGERYSSNGLLPKLAFGLRTVLGR